VTGRRSDAGREWHPAERQDQQQSREQRDDDTATASCESLELGQSDRTGFRFRWERELRARGPRSATTRFVLLMIGTYMSEQGDRAFPTTATLASDTCLSERAVCEHIEKAHEWLQYRSVGKSHKHIYRAVIPPDDSQRADAESVRSDGERTDGGSARSDVRTDPDAVRTDPDDSFALTLTHACIKSINKEVQQKARTDGRSVRPRFARPDFILPEIWNAYERMRKRIRKPMDDDARRLVIEQLQELRSQGHDVIALLKQSIRNGWPDFYPPKADGSKPTPRPDPTRGAI
jgi:hypothetical protein